jgi:uncharacterized protein (TIGR02301 family)
MRRRLISRLTTLAANAGLLAICAMAARPGATVAQESVAVAPLKPGDTKPYDEKLARLSEILGAVHYLRELCGQNDGQQWRERMREILEADGGSPLRRAMLTRSFNNGYRSYGRTYQSCTPSAQAAIGRFMADGAQIADGLVKSVP